MSGIVDGQAVDAAQSNAAWLARNGATSGIGPITLSGPQAATISDIQVTANVILVGIGGDQVTPATGYAAFGAPSATILDGETHVQSLVRLAKKFDPSTGHKHSGAVGDGGLISYGSLTGTQLMGFAVHAVPLTAASGVSSNVTGLVISGNSYNSAATGPVSLSPYNYVHVFSASGSSYLDATGNKVYARLSASPATATAPSAWTLSYYSQIAGTQTAYSFPASSYVDWYYQGLYTEALRPVYSDVFIVDSDQVAGEIPDATQIIRGKVLLSSASAVSVGSSNAIGTPNATVANADHAHQGVHSIAASGGAALFGDVILAASGGMNITQSGNTVTFTASSAGGGGTSAGGILIPEVPLGVPNGSASVFTLSTLPTSSGSVAVWVDDVPQINPTNYSVAGSAITFQAGSVPQPGQQVFALYPVASSAAVSYPITGASNVGSGAGTWFDVSGTLLRFKSIKPGSNITVSDDGIGSITINSTAAGLSVFGSRSAPVSIAASAGITPTAAMDQVWWVTPNVSGAVSVSVNSGSSVGQRLALFGTSLANYLVINDGAGTDQNGNLNLTSAQSIVYHWDGVFWSELSRRS